MARPLTKAQFELGQLVLLGREDLVQQRALSDDTKVGW
jgi:hypothetical protein